MSTIKSSNEHLTLNADGASKEVKIQRNGTQVLATTSTGIDVTGTVTAVGSMNIDHSGSDTFATLVGPLNRDLRIDLQANDDNDSLVVRDLRDNSERFVVNAGGNVGIGTSTPLAPVVASTTVTADSDKIVYGMTQSDNNAGRIVGMGIASTGSVANQGISFYTCLSSVQSERMRIDSYGQVTMPSQPAFSVTKTSAQSIAPGSDRTITWETEEFDVGSNFASDIFTAPITGTYFLHALVKIDDVDTAASYYRTSIQSSNKDKYEIIRPLFTADLAYMSMSVASIFDMDAGDTAKVTVRQQSGSTQASISATGHYSNFCGYLLG